MGRANELEWAVARIPLLRAVPFEDLRRICTYMSLRTLARDTEVWSAGQLPDGFSFVVEGRVKLAKQNPDGKETILDLVEDGRLLCGTIPYACKSWCCTATVAKDETKILSVLRQHGLELMARYPLVVQDLLSELVCRTTVLCSRVSELGASRVDQRLALLLLRLGEQLGEDDPEGTWIPFSMSRRDLAELCGTTVESAIRAMCKLEKASVVITRSRGFLVRDEKALGRLAEGFSPRSLLDR